MARIVASRGVTMHERNLQGIACATAALVALAGCIGDGGPAAPATDAVGPASGTGLAFRLEDTGSHGSEVNLGVTSGGAIFFGGWDHIARSLDDGATWKALTNTRPLVNVAADRVLIVDKDTDRVFFDDTDLACTILTWSDDLGETWTTNPAACGGGVTDHQKIAVGARRGVAASLPATYPNVVYVCANGLTHTPCAASLDGGRTFGPGMPSQQLDVSEPGASTLTCAFQGAPVADAQGILYQPTTQCGAALWRSGDNGFTWTHSSLPMTPSGDAADVATTPDGAVYFFLMDAQWRPVLLHSPDGGASWGAPLVVAPAGLTSALFPVVTAGDDGRVGLAFYGTTSERAGWDGNPGDAPDRVAWHLYVAVVTEADAAAPNVTLVKATPDGDPVQYGCVSKLGRCLGNIADYIDIDVGPDGRVYVAFVDGCPPGCTTASESTAEDGFVAVQTAGPLLRAATPLTRADIR